MDESKWQQVWKVIADEPVEERDLFFGHWHLLCEGDELDEEKAKKSLGDPESEWCLDWSKDIKELKGDVWDLMMIQNHQEDDREGKWIEEEKRLCELDK